MLSSSSIWKFICIQSTHIFLIISFVFVLFNYTLLFRLLLLCNSNCLHPLVHVEQRLLFFFHFQIVHFIRKIQVNIIKLCEEYSRRCCRCRHRYRIIIITLCSQLILSDGFMETIKLRQFRKSFIHIFLQFSSLSREIRIVPSRVPSLAKNRVHCTLYKCTCYICT